MCAHWKAIDDFSKNIFEELAEEGRRMYSKRVAEYEAKYPSVAPPKKKKAKCMWLANVLSNAPAARDRMVRGTTG